MVITKNLQWITFRLAAFIWTSNRKLFLCISSYSIVSSRLELTFPVMSIPWHLQQILWISLLTQWSHRHLCISFRSDNYHLWWIDVFRQKDLFLYFCNVIVSNRWFWLEGTHLNPHYTIHFHLITVTHARSIASVCKHGKIDNMIHTRRSFRWSLFPRVTLQLWKV